MGESSDKLKSIVKLSMGYPGIRLIDPIEIYHIPSENTFYPIISKSGCTSIKVMLIRKFKANYENTFPAIHQVNPAKETNNEVQRLYFNSKRSYRKWTRGKNMVFVMRDPLSRIYSCYIDVVTGKNTMYKFPSGLDWFFDFKKDLTFDVFLEKVCGIPDRFSDRHFRSQSFYLSDSVRSGLESLEVHTLKDFMKTYSSDTPSNKEKPVKLNTNNSTLSIEMRSRLLENQEFRRRFKTDLSLFNATQKDSSENGNEQ